MAAEQERPAPRKRTRKPAQTEEVPNVVAKRKYLASGFNSVRELLSYILGTGILIYGVVEAPPDRQLIVVGAGLSLLGLPIVGGLFEKRGQP